MLQSWQLKHILITMDSNQEAKVLKEYLDISKDPQSYRTKYSKLSTLLLVIGWFGLFLLTFIYLENYNNLVVICFVGLISGGSLALGLIFKQMANQAKLLSKHLSRTSIKERLKEISF